MRYKMAVNHKQITGMIDIILYKYYTIDVITGHETTQKMHII